MLPYVKFTVAIVASLVGVSVQAQEPDGPGEGAWLNGYVAGRVLADYYQDEDKEAFIRGILEGIRESDDRAMDDDEIRDAKVSWFEDATRSRKERASYAAGYLSGSAYVAPDSPYSPYLFTQGWLDSLQHPGGRYVDKDEGTTLVADYQRTLFYRKKRQVADRIATNEREGQAFLAANAQQPGIVQSASGLQYRVLRQGQGGSPGAEDTVVVSLVGRKIDGEVFYDSQNSGSGSTTIRVGETLNGWQEALVNMSPGAEWELFLPANLAYGNAGWQGVVDPGETLIYRLELLEVIEPN